MEPIEDKIPPCDGPVFTYRLLVEQRILKTLLDIVEITGKITLEDLCKKFEEESKHKLNYFITPRNDLVLELESCDLDVEEPKIKLKRIPNGWSEIEKLVINIDFSNVITRSIQHTVRQVDLSDYEIYWFDCIFHGDQLETRVYENTFNYHIANFFDKVKWNYSSSYPGYIANIYDPSKFWVRFADVEMLDKLLFDFYQGKNEFYRFHSDRIFTSLNCVVFLRNKYYRARIVRTDVFRPDSFIAFLYDYGEVLRVFPKDILRMHCKFTAFPGFAVRCSLTNISPLDNDAWTIKAVEKFQELTKGKKLYVRIRGINRVSRSLDVYLADTSSKTKDTVPTINNLLVEAKLAKVSWEKSMVAVENPVFKRKTKYPYLYPLHETIENGLAPASLELTKKLMGSVQWDVLFPALYKLDVGDQRDVLMPIIRVVRRQEGDDIVPL